MIGLAAIWLLLCFPQCFPHKSISEAVMGVRNESLEIAEKEGEESHGHATQAVGSDVEGTLKSVSSEVSAEPETLTQSFVVEQPSTLRENDSITTEENDHNFESLATIITHTLGESTDSELKVSEIFAPIKDEHKHSDAIKAIHKLKSIDDKLTRITLIEHTSSIHVQEAKVQAGIPKDASEVKTDRIEDSVETKNIPLASDVQDSVGQPSSDEALGQTGPEPPERQKQPPTTEPLAENADNMPSFNEWTQKRLAEQEQKESNVPPSTSAQGKTIPIPKMRQKNYASADCGAKILGSNSEAQSAYAVLNGYHDEYMLNPCTAKIWLVIELCEPIQAKKIEIANFELFSSSPREFVVSSSDRFPTRDWNALGTFEAKEEKTIQSFNLDQKIFHKFIKIELFSHYGSEHYCPVSLVRVYGTSELEVLDNDDEHSQPTTHDLDGDGLPDDSESPGEPQSPNLFGSAKDAVMSIVKKAAEALSRDKNAQEVPLVNTEEIDSNVYLSAAPNNTDQCVTVVQSTRDTLNASNASDCEPKGDAVEKVLSCNYQFLTNLLALEAVNEIINTCSLCNASLTNNVADVANVSNVDRKCLYLQILIGPVRFAALCSLVKINRSLKPLVEEVEHKLYPNISEIAPSLESHGIDITMSKTPVFDNIEEKSMSTSIQKPESSDQVSEIASETPPLPLNSGPVVSSPDLPIGIVNSSQSLKELIQPTKTLKPDDIGGDVAGMSEDAGDSAKSVQQVLDTTEVSEKEQDDKSSLKDTVVTSDPTTESMSRSDGLVDTTTADTLPKAAHSESSVVDSSLEILIGSEFTSNVDGGESSLANQMTSLPPGMKKDIPSTTASNKTSPSTGVASNTQKESVFVRLSNRIKALELNMSLSTQYLEELSQRYRKQMEEMQRAFNKTINGLNETARKAHEHDVKQQEIINSLQNQIDNLSTTVDMLLADRESLSATILEPHVFIIFVELMLAAFMYALLRRHSVRYLRTLKISGDETLTDSPVNFTSQVPHLDDSERSLLRRRNSFSGCSSTCSKPQRRPSEEALNISGTYADLMMVEPVIPIMLDQPKVGEGKRRKQRYKKNSRESVGSRDSVSDCCLNFASNIHKQCVGKLTKNTGSLRSENRIVKCDPTHGALPAHNNNLKTKSCQESHIRGNCAKKRTSVCKKSCCPFNSTDFVSHLPSEMLCNGIESRSKSSSLGNGSCVSESRNASDEFILKKILLKWFWWLRR